MIRRKALSIRTYFALVFGLLVIVLALFISSLIGRQASEAVRRSAGQILAATAHHMADQMDTFMWSRMGEVYSLTHTLEFSQPEDPAAIRRMLDNLQVNFPTFSWVGYTDAAGTVLSATGGILEGADISARPVYQEALKGKFIGDVHDAVLLAKLLPNPTGEPMKFVDISMPVQDEAGGVRGVLAAHLSWKWADAVQSSVMEPLSAQESIEMLVLSARNNVVLLGPQEKIGTMYAPDPFIAAKANDPKGVFEIQEADGPHLVAYATADGYLDYSGLGWTIVVRQPLGVAYARVEALQRQILLLGGASALLFAFCAYLLAGYVSRPMVQITRAAEAIRSGDARELPEFHTLKEVESLSLSLRSLVSSLTHTTNALDHMVLTAHRDALTQLANRNGLKHYLEQLLPTLAPQGRQAMLLCLDLDRFKPVNDRYGHAVGDALLKAVADRMRQLVRSDELVARVGGDEFIVVLNAAAPEPSASHVAQRLLSTLSQPYALDGITVEIGCSIGGALWAADEDFDAVLKRADAALYRSKEEGRGRFTWSP